MDIRIDRITKWDDKKEKYVLSNPEALKDYDRNDIIHLLGQMESVAIDNQIELEKYEKALIDIKNRLDKDINIISKEVLQHG